MARKRDILDYATHLTLWYENGINLERRWIDINGEIDTESTVKICRAIRDMEFSAPDDPIEIRINSEGGFIYSANAVVDLLLACSCPIHMCATGQVGSSATDIFMAGDVRTATPNTLFLFHSGSDKVKGKIFVHEDELKSNVLLWERGCDLYAERSGYKNKKWWMTWTKYRDQYITVEKAVEMGVITES